MERPTSIDCLEAWSWAFKAKILGYFEHVLAVPSCCSFSGRRLRSNDKLMPNSCLDQILLVDHHGIAASRKSCLSHAQIIPNLKTPWNRAWRRIMFPHLGKSNVRKNPFYSCILPFMFLGLRNTCRFGPLTFFALLLSVHQWLRSAIRDSQQPTSPIGFLFLKPRRAERRLTT